MKRIITTVGTLAIAATASLAQDSPIAPDRQHDRQPVPNPREGGFGGLDKNHDGALSFREFAAGREGREARAKAEVMFKRMDHNGDGKVTAEEFRAFHQPQPPVKPKAPNLEERFRKMDADGDGSLSLDEFLAGLPDQKDAARAKEHFNRMDHDGDGSVSFAEFRAANQPKKPSLEEVFRRMDTDHDGFISLDEFRAAHQGHKEPNPHPDQQPEPNNGGEPTEPPVERES